MVIASIITTVGVFDVLDTHQLIAPRTACGRETIVTLESSIDCGEIGTKTVRTLLAESIDEYGKVIKGKDILVSILAGRMAIAAV